jgi:hypothetical protein
MEWAFLIESGDEMPDVSGRPFQQVGNLPVRYRS